MDVKSELNALLEEFDRLTDKPKELVFGFLIEEAKRYNNAIDSCESPIEEHLAIALEKEIFEFNTKHSQIFHVKNQEKIKIGDKTYRADFLISCLLGWNPLKVVVECDGHDFHEKTKEQAARDKSRDRDFQKAGYIVLRFTGSEIWRSAVSCAMEVIKILEKRSLPYTGE